MTLKTSSRKINPFWNMVWFTIRKNLGIIIVLCIIALLFCPGVYIVNFEDLLDSRYTEYQTYGETPQDYTETFGTVIAVFAPIFMAIFNFINFSFLYKKNASDLFHSLPLTRTELLLSRMLASVLSSIIPVLLCTVFYVLMVIFNPWLGHLGYLLYYLALTLVFTVLWASFTMLFIVCAGSSFDLVLSFFGVNTAIIIVAFIVNAIFNEMLLGYSGDVEQILFQISLPFFCAKHQTTRFWIISIVYIAVFITAALLLYNRRKAEKGGTAYAYKFMYYICSVLISICGGYLVGILFDNDIDFSTVFWIFALIGAIVFALIYGLITNRGLKGSSRSVIMGGIAWVVMLAIMLLSVTGGFGFTKRVPNIENIEEVRVSALGIDATFTEPDVVIALHKKIIPNAISYANDNSTHKKQIIHDSTGERVDYIYLYYTLKDGATFERRFLVPHSTINQELLAVYKDDERYDNIIKESQVNAPSIEQIAYSYYTESAYNATEGYINVAEYKEFLDTYWQELKEIKHFSEIEGEAVHFTIDHGDERSYFTLDFGDKFYDTINCINNFKYAYLKYLD